MLIKQWLVDEEKYRLSEHDILLSTTEYRYKTTVLSAQIISRRLGESIRKSIKPGGAYKHKADEVRYYAGKTYGSNCSQIKQTTFFELLIGFNNSETAIRQEILEKFNYIKEDGSFASIAIAVVREDNEETKATIEFKSEREMEEFVLPEWLLCKYKQQGII